MHYEIGLKHSFYGRDANFSKWEKEGLVHTFLLIFRKWTRTSILWTKMSISEYNLDGKLQWNSILTSKNVKDPTVLLHTPHQMK